MNRALRVGCVAVATLAAGLSLFGLVGELGGTPHRWAVGLASALSVIVAAVVTWSRRNRGIG